MNVVLAKTDTGRAVSTSFALARERLPGSGKIAEQRRQAKIVSSLRIAAP